MRSLFAFLLLPLLAAAAPRDWSVGAAPTPTGNFVRGNPAARAKLVEYASYTCPHCAAFATESDTALTAMVRSGSTSVELRNLIRDQADLAAATVAHCGGARRFFATSQAIFAQQPQWLARAIDYQGANGERLRMYPVLGRLRAIADGAGLTAIGKANGLTEAQVDACFADAAALDRIVAANATLPAGVEGTPTFFVNGKLVPHVGWTQLQPALRAAGAR